MKKYLLLCRWAFTVLWKEKTITWADRLRLWRKTLNLFLCFIGFTDDERPEGQLKGAMISALLSAIYDYETDWIPVKNLEVSIYRRLLKEHASHSSKHDEALQLFITDWKGKLSDHGLERGGSALVFYHSLINSKWMSEYQEAAIRKNGRLLQLVDDLVDLKEDRKNGHTNCFLTDDYLKYVEEARIFLRDRFFTTLRDKCFVYYPLEFESARMLNQKEGSLSNEKRDALQLLRPFTGIYAFVLTILGFRFFSVPFLPAIVAAVLFVGITWSIMVWNDYVDRKRDLKKNKVFAFQNPWLVCKICWHISWVTFILLVFCAFLSWHLALLGFSVWVLGFLYSITKPRYPFNNLIVAFCSGSPALAGMVYWNTLNWKVLIVFFIMFSTIILMELVKDIQDLEGDRGYKKTLPTLKGKIKAVVTANMFCFLPIIGTLMYPNRVVTWTALFLVPIAFNLGLSYFETRPKAIYWAEKWGDAFVATVIVVLFIVQ